MFLGIEATQAGTVLHFFSNVISFFCACLYPFLVLLQTVLSFLFVLCVWQEHPLLFL